MRLIMKSFHSGQAPLPRMWRKWTRQRRERRWWDWQKRFPEKEFRILLQVANLLDPNAEAPAKKSRLEQFGNAAPGAMQGNEAISEEAVRRWRCSPSLPSICLRLQTTKISSTPPSHVHCPCCAGIWREDRWPRQTCWRSSAPRKREFRTHSLSNFWPTSWRR